MNGGISSSGAGRRSPARPVRPAALALVALTWTAPAVAQGVGADRGCEACHGEIEFLRQHADNLAGARRLLVTELDLGSSAHQDDGCAACHSGFVRWPHPPSASTQGCVDCHDEAAAAWHEGIHAAPPEGDGSAVTCDACHGSHRIAPVEALREGPAMREMNARCVDCHEGTPLPLQDPHLDSVPCVGCHAPHETQGVDEPSARVAPLRQGETCGACHEEVADASMADVHGRELADRAQGSLATLELGGADAAPACTTCHGGHGMRRADDPSADPEMVDRCAGCHAGEADRYFGTYHGKATALGSRIVATCDDCHLAHGVEAAADPGSAVHPDRLQETCRACHAASRAAFVAYDSHPDPMDRSRNAPLFYSFVFMNTLLFGVLIVFGLHTLLWWVRIGLDRRKEGREGHHA
ncbi:MAG TPA: hypothetical protein VK858_17745 [Longimicrobiales bacterium]|nr:hypothetical protein [Longimicrobiales bacterium]